jgi:tetratricopeptide (TPR) repeat protein
VAAERAAALNAFGAAATQFERALELLPDAARERPRLLFSRAEALFHSGDGRSEQALEEARDASLATGDRETAAEAAALLAEVSWFRGRGADCAAHLDRARELITAVDASRARARVLGQIARYRMLAADYAPAIRLGREAGEMAHELGMAGVEAQALITVGSARGFSGDAEGGKADIHRGLALALQHNLLRVAARAYNNLAAVAETADETLKLTAAAEETYMRLGDTHGARYPRATHAGSLCGLGRWDEALELADAFIAASDAGSPHYQEPIVRVIRALIRYGRDDVDAAFADVRVAIDLARDAGDPQNLCPTLGFAARLYADLELVDEARALAEEALAHMRSSGWVFDLALVAHRLGVAGRVRELIVGGTPWQDAALAVLENRIADGATLMDRLGNRTWAAELRLRGGEALIDEGHADEAAKELEAALEFYRSVGATRFIRWAESLLAAPTL